MSKIKPTNTLSAAQKIAEQAKKMLADQINQAEFTQAIQNSIGSIKGKHLRAAKDIERLYTQINQNIDYSKYHQQKQNQVKEILLTSQFEILSNALDESGIVNTPDLHKAITGILTKIESLQDHNTEHANSSHISHRTIPTTGEISFLPKSSDNHKKLIQQIAKPNPSIESGINQPAEKVSRPAKTNINNVKSLFEQITDKENIGKAMGMQDSVFKNITGKEDIGKLIGIKDSIFKNITGKKHLGEVLDSVAKKLRPSKNKDGHSK